MEEFDSLVFCLRELKIGLLELIRFYNKNLCEIDVNKIIKMCKVKKLINFDVKVFIKNKISEIEALQILNSKVKIKNKNNSIIKLYDTYYKSLNNLKISLKSFLSV